MDPEQLTLAGVPGPRARRPKAPAPVAEDRPVARVLVDRSQPHLDRPFEYAVPASCAQDAVPGVRVKVRFAGQDVDGLLVERLAVAEHDGALTPLRRVVSAEPVLAPEIHALAQAVADRYVGTLGDVLRLAIPPRHARVEQEDWGTPAPGVPPEAPPDAPPDAPDPVDPDGWSAYPGGAAFCRHLAGGGAPRAVWQALPGHDGAAWADLVATAVRAARAGRRGSVLVVPSAAEVEILTAALLAADVPAWRPGTVGGFVRLVAEDGPAARYRAFLAVLRGAADVVVGTRAAAFAPVHAPGLLLCWDDADPLHAEPRAPYPHAREVLGMRSARSGAALLVGGYTRSVSAQRWVATGWAAALVAPREVVRARTARIVSLDSVELAREGAAAAARLPAPAWRALRAGLEHGPVLVQVPRAGYLPAVACRRCRTLARCRWCAGPLHVPGPQTPARCRWCARLATGWTCPECGDTGLRSVRVGSERTAEELGRAFPGVPVRRSSAASGVIPLVDARPALVVATTGAEPRAVGGYAAAALLDAGVTSGRPGLDAAESALRTWLAAAALVRPGSEGGVVLLVGDAAPAPVGALVRWDPAGLAERELAERTELGLPPAQHFVALDGPRRAVEDLLAALRSVDHATAALGPTPRDEAPEGVLDPETERPVRVLLRTTWAAAPALQAELKVIAATRSARREQPVRLQVEPTDLA